MEAKMFVSYLPISSREKSSQASIILKPQKYGCGIY